MTNETTSGAAELLPWSYRPREHDDWGWIRSSDGTLIALARCDHPCSQEEFDAHRTAGTDPYEKTGRLIVDAVNGTSGAAEHVTGPQQLVARVKRTSKYAYQAPEVDWFPVRISRRYPVVKGNNNAYELSDVVFGVRLADGSVMELKL